MFYSTRHVLRLALLLIAAYLAVTRIPWDSVKAAAGTSWRRLEWNARNLGNALGNTLEGFQRGIKDLLK
jgi:hypothetical protein